LKRLNAGFSPPRFLSRPVQGQTLQEDWFVGTSREMVAMGEFVFQLVGGCLEQDGQSPEWETAGVLRVGDGQILECWLVPLDKHLFDEVWS
jgi:hypothetical protein